MAKAGAKEKPARRMREILDCAAKVFYAKGFHATTVEDIAADVGMLKGSLYYYIKSKEDLLYELLMDVILRGETTLDEKLDGVQDPVERLRRALEGQIEHIMENQVRVGLFLHEFDTLSGKRQSDVQKVMQRYQTRFVEIIREGQKAGVFIKGDPWLLVNGVLGMGNWIYRWYGGHHQPDLETVKTTFIQLILTGVQRQ